MDEQCPRCGAALSSLRCAFCSECRQPLDEQARSPNERESVFENRVRITAKQASGNPFEALSIPARLWIAFSIFAAPAGTVLVICSLYDSLPPGTYPIWFFAVPVLVVVSLCCVGGLALFHLSGIPVWRRDRTTRPKGASEARRLLRSWCESLSSQSQQGQ